MTDFGYLLPTREVVMRGQSEAAPLLALADRAEAAGYRSVWVGDSILAKPRHEPLTMLAALAGRTSDVLLGTAVLLPALRHPVVLAHSAATVDLLSEGRLVLGVGMGASTPGNRAEFAGTGVPFANRGQRMVENLDLCRSLWTGQPVSQEGGLFPVSDIQLLPTPHRAGGPPIWAAGQGPVGRRRAAELYDGWFPIGAGRAEFHDGVAEVRELAEAAGRPSPTIAMYLTVSIDDDQSQAEATLDSFLTEYYAAPAEMLRGMQACVAGPAEKIAEEIRAWETAGAEHIVVRFAGDHERHFEAMAPVISA